jgi:hypothetical protein
MHKLLIPGVSRIDHRNRDGLDNRRENLRPATQSQNMANSRSRPGSSLFKGVSWIRRDRRWYASIMFNYRSISLGNYVSEIEAAKAYNAAAIRLFGEYARLNEIVEPLPCV